MERSKRNPSLLKIKYERSEDLVRHIIWIQYRPNSNTFSFGIWWQGCCCCRCRWRLPCWAVLLLLQVASVLPVWSVLLQVVSALLGCAVAAVGGVCLAGLCCCWCSWRLYCLAELCCCRWRLAELCWGCAEAVLRLCWGCAGAGRAGWNRVGNIINMEWIFIKQ